jgi:2'-5' RNA ligase
MRLFAAIDIDSQIRDRIEQIQRQLQRDLNLRGREVKWVRPDQMHLTLKFLGEVRDEMVTDVCQTVTQTAAQCGNFDLHIRGLGVFGRPARVVWVGTEPNPALAALQTAMDSGFEKIGWDREQRPFAGHLTVCRVKTAAAGKKLADAVDPWQDEVFGTVWVDKVVLYESRLSSAGPEYSAVCTAQLK